MFFRSHFPALELELFLARLRSGSSSILIYLLAFLCASALFIVLGETPGQELSKGWIFVCFLISHA